MRLATEGKLAKVHLSSIGTLYTKAGKENHNSHQIYNEIDGKYDRTTSVKDNAKALNIPVRSLYQYCRKGGLRK